MILRLDDLLDLHLIDFLLEQHRPQYPLIPPNASQFCLLDNGSVSDQTRKVIANAVGNWINHEPAPARVYRRTENIEFEFLAKLISGFEERERKSLEEILERTKPIFPFSYPSSGLFAGYDFFILEERAKKAMTQDRWSHYVAPNNQTPPQKESFLSLQDAVPAELSDVQKRICQIFSHFSFLCTDPIQLLAILTSSQGQFPTATKGGIVSSYDPILIQELFAEQIFPAGGIVYHQRKDTYNSETGARIPTLLWGDPTFGTIHAAYVGKNSQREELAALEKEQFPFHEASTILSTDRKLVKKYIKIDLPPTLEEKIERDRLKEELQHTPQHRIRNPAVYLLALADKLSQLQQMFTGEEDIPERLYNYLDSVLPRTEPIKERERNILTHSARASWPTVHVQSNIVKAFDPAGQRCYYGKIYPGEKQQDPNQLSAEEIMLRTVLHHVHYDSAGLTNTDDLSVEQCGSEGYVLWTPDFGPEHLNQRLRRLRYSRDHERQSTRRERLQEQEFHLKNSFFRKIARFHAYSALYLTSDRQNKREYVDKAMNNLRRLFSEQLSFEDKKIREKLHAIERTLEIIALLIPESDGQSDRTIRDITFADVCFDNQIPVPHQQSTYLATIDLFPLRRRTPAYELEVSLLLGRIDVKKRVKLREQTLSRYAGYIHEALRREYAEYQHPTERDLWLGVYYKGLQDAVLTHNQIVLTKVKNIEEEAKRVLQRMNTLLAGKGYPTLQDYFGWIDERTPPLIPQESRDFFAQCQENCDEQYHLRREEWRNYDSHLERVANTLFPFRCKENEPTSTFERVIVEGVRGYVKSLVTKEIDLDLMDDLLLPHIAIFRTFDLLRKRRELIHDRTYGHASAEPELQQHLLTTAVDLLYQLRLKYLPLSSHTEDRSANLEITTGTDALHTFCILHKTMYGNISERE